MDFELEEGFVAELEDFNVGPVCPWDSLDADGWQVLTPAQPSLTPPQDQPAPEPADPSFTVPLAVSLSAQDSDEDVNVPDSGLDDDGYLRANWAMDESGIRECLLSFGLVGTRLALQRNDERILLKQLLEHLGIEVSGEQFSWHLALLRRETRRAVEGVPLAKRLRGDGLPIAMQYLRDQDKCNRLQKAQATTAPKVPDQYLLPPKGQRRSRMLAAVSMLTKVEADELECRRHLSLVIKLFEDSEAPVVAIANRTSNPVQIFRGALGDTRAGTLRQYLRALTAFQNWLICGTQQLWPTSVSTVLEYLHTRTEEPCPPSIPQTFVKGLCWFEKAGAFESGGKFGTHPLVQKTVDYACEMLSIGLAPPRKAPRPPTALLAALEIFVCEKSYPDGKRAKAVQILFKSYCSLREDDVQNLVPKQFRYFSGILVNSLHRTKTTGPTKRVKELPFCLSAEMSITGLPWLHVGLELVQKLGDPDRDHFLPNFSSDLKFAKPGRLSYANSAALGKALISELKVPVFCDGVWKSSATKLIPAIFTAAFTEHGPRAFMPTVLAELEKDKTEKDYVGRWSPTGSDDYTRSFRAVVKRLQHEALAAIKASDSRLGEGDVLERLTIYGETIEAQDVGAHIQWLVENLKSFQGSLKVAALHEWEETVVVSEPEITPAAVIQATNEDIAKATKRQLARIPRARDLKFLIIYSQGRRFARLHRSDTSCPWAYTIVRDCEEISDPKAAQYNARCKICYPSADSDTSNSEEEIA